MWPFSCTTTESAARQNENSVIANMGRGVLQAIFSEPNNAVPYNMGRMMAQRGGMGMGMGMGMQQASFQIQSQPWGQGMVGYDQYGNPVPRQPSNLMYNTLGQAIGVIPQQQVQQVIQQPAVQQQATGIASNAAIKEMIAQAVPIVIGKLEEAGFTRATPPAPPQTAQQAQLQNQLQAQAQATTQLQTDMSLMQQTLVALQASIVNLTAKI